MNRSITPLRLAALAALALAATTARAQFFLVENLTGSFSPNTTLDGVALGGDTAFSIAATFNADPSANQITSVVGAGSYSVTALTLTLAGHGTYAGIPSAGLNVVLLDTNGAGHYAAGLADLSGGTGFFDVFGSTTPALDAHAPSATTFVGFLVPSDTFPYTIGLVGIPGGLVINDLGGDILTASITAVPEPAEYAAVAGLGLGVFALVRRGRQASAPVG